MKGSELFNQTSRGHKKHLVVRHIGQGEAIEEQFRKFDASKASCFLPEDRERLLAVIEAGFGDLHPFSKLVAGLLEERLNRETSFGLKRILTSGKRILTGGPRAEQRGGGAVATRAETAVVVQEEERL